MGERFFSAADESKPRPSFFGLLRPSVRHLLRLGGRPFRWALRQRCRGWVARAGRTHGAAAPCPGSRPVSQRNWPARFQMCMQMVRPRTTMIMPQLRWRRSLWRPLDWKRTHAGEARSWSTRSVKKEQLNTAWVARLHVPRSSLLDDSNSLSSVMPRTPQQQLVRQGAAARQSPEDRETLPPSGESGGATSTLLLFYTQLLVPAREEVLAMDDRWSEALEPLGGGTPSSGDVLLLCEECCAQLHRAYASGLEFPKSLVSCVCSLAESGRSSGCLSRSL